MKLNKAQLAREIEKLAKIKARQSALELEAEKHILVIRKAGGGESKNWLARLIKIPEKRVVVKAHKQLRLTAKKLMPIKRVTPQQQRRQASTALERWPYPDPAA